MHRRKFLACGLGFLAATALPSFNAFGQEEYPTRPVRLVVPFPPGGVMDTVARLWADKVGASLGTLVIDNRSGAGGVVGAGEAARAKPDGYTILLGNTSTQVINPTIMRRPPYDPVKDFVTIDMIAQSATSIIVHPSMPVRTLKQLIDYARANPGKLSYGSAGAGTVTHLAGEMFKQRAGGLDIVHVPYKGIGLATADLLGGYIPVMTPNLTAQLINLHRTGKVRILAVNAPAPLKAAPEIPIASTVVPDMVTQLFIGLFAPADAPKAAIEKLSQVTRKALADEAFQTRLIQSGFEPVVDSSPQKAQAFIEQEQKRLIPLIQATGLKRD